jgi:hypothetical protein
VKEKGEAGGSHGASSEVKVVGLSCHDGTRADMLGEGVRAWVHCDGDGGGVDARAIVEHRATRERGRER